MSQTDLATRREEARRAMEGDERRAARAAREQATNRRRVEARLAMESPTHRARREVLERAVRESRAAVAAREAATEEARTVRARATAETEAKMKAKTMAEEAEKTMRISKAHEAAATIKTLTGTPAHLSAIRTLKTDMATAVSQGGSVAGAIIRAGDREIDQTRPPVPTTHSLRLAILIFLLLGTLAGGGAFFYRRDWFDRLLAFIPGLATSTPPARLNPPRANPVKIPFIVPDERVEIETANQTTPVLLEKIREVRATAAANETVKEVVFLKNGTPLNFRAWQTLFELPFPENLLRNADPVFMFGFYYTADDHTPFLTLKTKSVERSYADLLVWEKNLPIVWNILIGKPPVDAVATTDSSSAAAASFHDQVIRNLDTRILAGAGVTQPALYGFLDFHTIILSQTRAAFLEILNRFRSDR